VVERRINKNGHRKRMNNEIQKVGLEAFNELAKSHDAHAKEVERLQKELDELNNLRLVNQDGELLLECKIGDKHHLAILEIGLTTILKEHLNED